MQVDPSKPAVALIARTLDDPAAGLPLVGVLAALPAGHRKLVSVEHPTGEFTVELEVDPQQPQNVLRAALLRTARLVMRGEVLVPRSVWDGQSALKRAA